MNIPNLLTLSRLLALPIVIALFRGGHGVGAAGVFLAAMLTDCLDGWAARRLGQVSRLGVYLDPVVDKVFILVLFYEIALAGVIPVAIPHLLLTREFLQSGVRTVGALNGKVVGANWMGKTKAVLQTPVLTAAIVSSSLANCSALNSVALFALIGAWFVTAIAWMFFGLFLFWNRDLVRGRVAGAERVPA